MDLTTAGRYNKGSAETEEGEREDDTDREEGERQGTQEWEGIVTGPGTLRICIT